MQHDIVARTALVTTSAEVVKGVGEELEKQLGEMPEPNKGTAMESIKKNGISVLCKDIDEC